MYRKFLRDFKERGDSKDSQSPKETSVPQAGPSSENKNNEPGTTENKKKPLTEEQRKKKEEMQKQLDELLRMCNETQALIESKMKESKAAAAAAAATAAKAKEQDESMPTETHTLFYGNVSQDCPSSAKVVRIFTSSTFTDTEKERNILMEQAYPKIKSYCQQRGYEFQVVDMRWGVRDEATDDHMTTELCLRELKRCKDISTGPYFVSLLSHKYGYRPLIREINAEEFEKIMQVTESEEKRQLLLRWYHRDDNNVPPVYVLESVSKNIPDFVSDDPERKKVARNSWWEEHETMHETLSSGAVKALDEEAARKFNISVTETEIVKGLQDNSDTANTCIWFKRTIEDIEQQNPNKQLSRYMECFGPEDKIKASKRLLNELRDSKLPQHLPENRICTYKVHWADTGINPSVQEHQEYLQKLANDFVSYLCDMVQEGIRRRSATQVNDPLYEECLQHVTFCREKCEDFYGREDTLEKIKEYIFGESHQPFVIHGSSGCGKTSIMAMAAKKAWDWLEGKVGVVLRFVGTTPKSSNINDFLRSITKQIKLLNQSEIEPTRMLDENLPISFYGALKDTKPTLPLVIVIDSLDQFDPSHGARQLAWLPPLLPKHVKMIVSTLEDEKYESFPKLKIKVKKEENFLNVPKLPEEDVVNIINHWLAKRGRTLTSPQRQHLLEAFNKCPLPLFLKLSFDEACRWTSHDAQSIQVLQDSIHDSIQMLFARLEKVHGKIFVSRTLGYMTTAVVGLSEGEMEDILACDDDVLNDVYQYWTPPTRRLPPLLLVRLKSDLQQYLVERGIDGLRVLFWYHRQFIRAAKERYCSDKNELISLHKGLADYFSGTWAIGKKKPYVDKKGNQSEANRYVSSQPLQFGSLSNIRKLNRLPYHLIHSGELDRLKRECLCHYKFLQLKLIETSVSQVSDDLILASNTFPEDEQIKLVFSAFQLSQQALTYNPCELPSQIVGRLAGQEPVANFVSECEKSPLTYIRPNIDVLTKPGGALKFALAGHKGSLRSIDLKKDGQTALTTADDAHVKIWDIKEGRAIKSFQTISKNPSSAHFVSDDSIILVEDTDRLIGYTERGDLSYNLPLPSKQSSFCLAAPNKSKIIVFYANKAAVYDASKGELLDTITHHSKIKFGSGCYPFGSENYAAVLDDQNEDFTVLDLAEKKFLSIRKGYEKDEDGDYPTIDAIAITVDEKKIIYANMMDNDLHFCDINTLEEVHVVKGQGDDMSTQFHRTSDGKYLYFPSNSIVVAYDLQTYERKSFFKHEGSVQDVLTRDFKTFVTITDEATVRVWDFTKEQDEKSITAQGFEKDENIKSVQPLQNGRYVFCVGDISKGSKRFCIFDVVENCVVRSATLMDKENYRKAVLLNDNFLAVVTKSRKLKVVDMNSLSITTVCQGILSDNCDDIAVLFNGKELAIPSRGRLFIKIYDTATGKTLDVMKGGQTQRIDSLKASQNSRTLIALADEGPYLIFDIESRQCTHVLDLKQFQATYFAMEDTISPDGKVVAIMASKKFALPNIPTKKTKSTEDNVVILWDVEKGQMIQQLHDRHMMLKYHIGPNKDNLSASADNIVHLDDTHILTSHDDYILRVWDIKTGAAVRRLQGHLSMMELSAIDGSPYFLSHGNMDEEKAIRLWDRKALKFMTSYRYDEEINEIHWLSTGKSFISTGSSSQIIHWMIVDNKKGQTEDLSKFPAIFEGKDLNLKLELFDEKDKQEDPDDPDTDPEEPEEVYSDDDDDDDDDDDKDAKDDP